MDDFNMEKNAIEEARMVRNIINQIEIERTKENLENILNRIPKELKDIQDNYDSFELKRLDDTLKQYKDLMYRGQEIFVETGPYGGVNYKVLEIIMDKSSNGETLTVLEKFILSEGVRRMGGERAPLFNFDSVAWKRGEMPGVDSPYLQLFDIFVDDLKNILADAGLLSRTSNGRVYNSLLEEIVKRVTIRDLRSSMGAAKHQVGNIGEDSLDIWFIRIQNEILGSSKVIHKEPTILQVEQLFERYYDDSKYSSQNPLYREARYLLFKFGEIVGKDSFKDLSSYLHYSVEYIFDGMKAKVNKLTSISSLITSINTYAMASLSTQDQNKVIELLNDYLARYDYFAKLKALRSPIRSYREFLIYNLQLRLFSHSSLTKSISDASLSQIFFGDRDYLTNIFLSSKQILMRPDYYVLMRIKTMTFALTVPGLKNEGIIITPASLKLLKQDIRDEVNRFMTKNPYEASYINENPRRGRGRVRRVYSQEFLQDEQYLVSAIFTAYAIHEDNPMLTFNFFKENKIYKGGLTGLLSQGKKNLGRKALKKIAYQVGQFYREALAGTSQNTNIQISQAELIQIYYQAIKQIISYKRIRKISFTTLPRNYDKLWDSKLVKSYHNVLLFARQLGFDLLTFKPLEDTIFALTPSGPTSKLLSFFRRHHINPGLKRSMLLQQLILTDVNIHNYYEKLGTDKVFALLSAFNELVVKDGPIDKDDIIRVFTKYGIKEDVYDNWYFKDPELGDNIAEFNNRKQKFRQLGLESFIENFYANKEYQAFYNRFYTIFKKDDLKRIMLFISNPAARDYSDWIATDYYFSKNPHPDIYFTISMDYLNYRPRMFKYW